MWILNSLRPSDAYMHRLTNHHWFRQWLVAWTAPSHSLNQCWNIVNWTLRNKLQWNFNRNSYIFIQENALENVVCEMASILPRPQCVNHVEINVNSCWSHPEIASCCWSSIYKSWGFHSSWETASHLRPPWKLVLFKRFHYSIKM